MSACPYLKKSCFAFVVVGWVGLTAACGDNVPLGAQDLDGGSTGGAGGGPADAPVGTGGITLQTGGALGTGGAMGTGGKVGNTCGGLPGMGFSSCPSGQFCDLASNCGAIDDATGVCVPTGPGYGCTMEYAPVCGCDGRSFGNDCERRLAGVLKASNGACGGGVGGSTGSGGNTGTGGSTGKVCGGIAGVTCPGGQFCDLNSRCNTIADATGICRRTGPGLVCAAEYNPVCGCNGRSYPSDCDRAVAGVLKASDGPCIARPDAGAAACSDSYLAWQAPGGVAGTGPAAVVCRKGWADTWTNVPPFEFDTPPSSANSTYTLTSVQTDDLFTRLGSTNLALLPHPSAGWMECYPTMYYRACATCGATTLSYKTASQLVPEMESVWAWFDQLLGASAVTNPRNYCAPPSL